MKLSATKNEKNFAHLPNWNTHENTAYVSISSNFNFGRFWAKKNETNRVKGH